MGGGGGVDGGSVVWEIAVAEVLVVGVWLVSFLLGF